MKSMDGAIESLPGPVLAEKTVSSVLPYSLKHRKMKYLVWYIAAEIIPENKVGSKLSTAYFSFSQIL